VSQGDEAATAGPSQSVGNTGVIAQAQPRDTPPVPRLSYTAMPTQKHAAGQAADSSSLSSPDLLERCVVLSDLSSRESPVTNGACVRPRSINSVTPPGVKRPACDDVTDAQETPLSVRSGRKRKRRKRHLHRPTLPLDSDDPVMSTAGSAVEGSPSDVTIKTEPRMPTLLPEPRVEYNPETPLRISIHLPLNAVITAGDGELGNENGDRSAVRHFSGDSREICSADSAMPVDLTSRASVQPSLPSSALSAADGKHCSSIGSVSSSVPSPRPVYSPISSISGRSTPDADNENVGSSGQEAMQPTVGIMASFLDRFNGMSAESLEFSPSQSIWTRSFADQLAAVNRSSFLAVHNLPAALLSAVTAADENMTELNRPRNVVDNSKHLASHSSLIPMSSCVMNNGPVDSIGHNTEIQDYVTVRQTTAAEGGLNGVFNVDLLNVEPPSSCEVDTIIPILCNGEPLSSMDTVTVNGIISTEADISPGNIFLTDSTILIIPF